MKNKYLKSPWFLFVLIILGILPLEFGAYYFLEYGYCSVSPLFHIVWWCLLLSVALFVIKGLFLGVYRWPSLGIISRFLDNSIKGGGIVFFLLFLFIIHLTWGIDMLCECIIKQDYSYWGQALVSVFSLTVLLCIFPYPDPVNKSDNSRETVISALSLGSKNGKNVLNWSNIDLLIKPFAPQAIKNEFGEEAKCSLQNLYIIPSNDLIKSRIDDDVSKYLNDKICNNDICKKIDEYNDNQNLVNLSQLIHQIIKLLYGQEISVCIYDGSVDYNSFDSVKKAVVEVLQKDE